MEILIKNSDPAMRDDCLYFFFFIWKTWVNIFEKPESEHGFLMESPKMANLGKSYTTRWKHNFPTI